MIKVNKVRLKGLAFHAYSFLILLIMWFIPLETCNWLYCLIGLGEEYGKVIWGILEFAIGQIWESEIYREQSIIHKGSQEKTKKLKK